MKSILLIITATFIANVGSSQSNFQQFNVERVGITKNAMLVLGSWGTANIAVGAIGLAFSHGEAKYFYQMNLIWGATNLAIAAPTFFSLERKEKDYGLSETVR